MIKKALIVMVKRPFPGATKTRLAPPLTETQAADLYAHFLRDALDLIRTVPDAKPVIAYAPRDPETATYFEEVAPDFEKVPQMGETLGERLNHVLSRYLALGFEQVVAMNSDSPTLPATYLQEAFVSLDVPTTDVVIGPCHDGGYYLIGWKKQHARLVREVPMSTARVLEDTLRLAAEENLSVALLPFWYDVDIVTDLLQLHRDLKASDTGGRYTRAYILRSGLQQNLRKWGKNGA